VLYRKDLDDNDELVYIEVDEPKRNFAIGCFEVFVSRNPKIEKLEKEIDKVYEKLRSEQSESIKKTYAEWIDVFTKQKQKLLDAETVEEIVMDYAYGKLRIEYNGKSIEIDDNKELFFRNIEIRIEKF
jgi:hypothetical protein